MGIVDRFRRRKAAQWQLTTMPDWFNHPDKNVEVWMYPLAGRSADGRHGIYVFPSAQAEGMWSFVIHAGNNSEVSMTGLNKTKEGAMKESVAIVTDQEKEYWLENTRFENGDRVAVDSYTQDLKDMIGQEGTIQSVTQSDNAWIYNVLFDDGKTYDVAERYGDLPNLRRI